MIGQVAAATHSSALPLRPDTPPRSHVMHSSCHHRLHMRKVQMVTAVVWQLVQACVWVGSHSRLVGVNANLAGFDPHSNWESCCKGCARCTLLLLCVQVMPQLLSLMELDVEDPNSPDW
jgi:hypothetical protein